MSKTARFTLTASAAFAAAMFAAMPVGAALITHTDTDFNSADWSIQGDLTSAGSTSSFNQNDTLGLGNVSPFREMEHNITMSGTGSPTSVNVRHLNNAFSYNPGESGAIDFVNLTMDAIILSVEGGTTPAVGHAFMLVQDDICYFYDLHDFTNLSWQTFAQSNLTAEDFSTFEGAHPDFSAEGGEMQFGYLRSNTNTGQTGDVTIRHGIDNFGVEIQAITVPGPATLCALAVAAALTRPRRRKLA